LNQDSQEKPHWVLGFDLDMQCAPSSVTFAVPGYAIVTLHAIIVVGFQFKAGGFTDKIPLRDVICPGLSQ
jgi:hypothetical protein